MITITYEDYLHDGYQGQPLTLQVKRLKIGWMQTYLRNDGTWFDAPADIAGTATTLRGYERIVNKYDYVTGYNRPISGLFEDKNGIWHEVQILA